jgi:hypothetical protein
MDIIKANVPIYIAFLLTDICTYIYDISLLKKHYLQLGFFTPPIYVHEFHYQSMGGDSHIALRKLPFFLITLMEPRRRIAELACENASTILDNISASQQEAAAPFCLSWH